MESGMSRETPRTIWPASACILDITAGTWQRPGLGTGHPQPSLAEHASISGKLPALSVGYPENLNSNIMSYGCQKSHVLFTFLEEHIEMASYPHLSMDHINRSWLTIILRSPVSQELLLCQHCIWIHALALLRSTLSILAEVLQS